MRSFLIFNSSFVTFAANSQLTAIRNATFTDCTKLASITIPASVTEIGNNAFNGCTALASATIGNSVTSIGNQAFRDCTGLLSVTFAGTIPAASFSSGLTRVFPGDLRDKFYATDTANGTPGTYTRASGGTTWTKQ